MKWIGDPNTDDMYKHDYRWYSRLEDMIDWIKKHYELTPKEELVFDKMYKDLEKTVEDKSKKETNIKKDKIILTRILEEGFEFKDSKFANLHIYEKGEEMIVYDSKNDRIFLRHPSELK